MGAPLFLACLMTISVGALAPVRRASLISRDNEAWPQQRVHRGAKHHKCLSDVEFLAVRRLTACVSIVRNVYESSATPGLVDIVLDAPAPVDMWVTLGVDDTNVTSTLDYYPLELTRQIRKGEQSVRYEFVPYNDGDDFSYIVSLPLFVTEAKTQGFGRQAFATRCEERMRLDFFKGPFFSSVMFTGKKRETSATKSFFDHCKPRADCNLTRLPECDQMDGDCMSYYIVSFPVPSEYQNLAFGVIRVEAGATLLVHDENDTDVPSHFMLGVQSVLVESFGRFQVGSPQAPFGHRSGSRFTLGLYGNETNSPPPFCRDRVRCGVPSGVWDGKGTCLTANPSIGRPYARGKVHGCHLANDPESDQMDYFYPYSKFPEPANDPEDAYFGRKVLGVGWGGALEMYGAWGTMESPSESGISWSRVAGAVPAGVNVKFSVADAGADWNRWPIGRKYRALLTSTDWYATHNEEISVEHLGDGTFVADQVLYPHAGKNLTLDDGVNVNRRWADLRAAFSIIDRSITILSRGAEATSELSDGFGGHVVARQGADSVVFQGILFEKLGQGGLRGRYPIHFHMARRTARHWRVEDSVVFDSNTRFIVLHGTHNVTITRSVGFQCFGHGVFLEDGSEIYNRITWNVMAHAKSGFRNRPNGYFHNPRGIAGIFSHPGNPTFNYPGCASTKPEDMGTILHLFFFFFLCSQLFI